MLASRVGFSVRTIMLWLTLSAIVAFTVGCTVISVHGENQAINKPLPIIVESGTLHIDVPRTQISPQWFTSPSFFGVALSGGGSRAANFSAAALQNLQEVGILQEADAISSVSGGGLTGAYYALNAPNVQWDVLRSKLRTNFWGLFLSKWAAPWNWPAIALTDKTKTDVMADVLDSVLFSGKEYREIPPASPIFLANATDITAGGKRVAFSNDYFVEELGSSLYNMRVATAVATSAAFPGIFDSVTVERFRRESFLDPRGGTYSWSPHSYVHLIDGGASDNLGVETLWDMAFSRLYGGAFTRMPTELGSKPCVIVSIDASAPNTSARFERLADERGVSDRLFNRNVFDAIDSLFEGRRQDTLTKMGLGQTDFGIVGSENFGDVQQNYVERQRVGLFDIPVTCRPYFGAVRCSVDFSKPIPPAQRRSFQCFVWHIALDEVAGVAFKAKDFESGDSVREKFRRGSLVRLERLVTQIETHWKLVGPDGCTDQQLQEALYAAARVLIMDDVESRSSLCAYMGGKGMTVDDACRKETPQTEVSISITGKQPLAVSLATDSSHTANLPVRCWAPDASW